MRSATARGGSASSDGLESRDGTHPVIALGQSREAFGWRPQKRSLRCKVLCRLTSLFGSTKLCAPKKRAIHPTTTHQVHRPSIGSSCVTAARPLTRSVSGRCGGLSGTRRSSLSRAGAGTKCICHGRAKGRIGRLTWVWSVRDREMTIINGSSSGQTGSTILWRLCLLD